MALLTRKKQALRIAGFMWGKDIDVLDNPEQTRDNGTPDREWFMNEFGVDYEKLKNIKQ